MKALTGGRGVDVVYDGVGGDISVESLRCVRFGARFLIVGWAATPFVARGKGQRGAPNANQLPTNLIMMKGLDVLGCPTVISTVEDPSLRATAARAGPGVGGAGQAAPARLAHVPARGVQDGHAREVERRGHRRLRAAPVKALLLALLVACATPRPVVTPPAPHMAWGLVMHGGAGVITRDKLTPEREAAIRADLERALRAAHAVLAKGGKSADAVTAAITILEDSPLFNAGKGAVFTHDGLNELDAAIMDGRAHTAGAVAGVRTIKNPILLAKAVMDNGRHVMLIGRGAEEFAATAGIEIVDPSYFRTEERWQQLQQALAEDRLRHRRRRRARQDRRPRRGHVDGRPHEQAVRPRRRLADHRRRHLRRRALRRLRDRPRRAVHSLHRRARHLRARRVRPRVARTGGR